MDQDHSIPVPAPSVQQIEKDFNIGQKFLIREGDPIKDYDLKKVKVVCLLFSAGYCPPCISFLPKLVEFYNEVNMEQKLLEIVYVSNDKTQQEFDKSFKQMPWIAIPFGDDRIPKTIENYEIKGIPMFVVLKRNFEPLNKKAQNEVINQGEQAFNRWLQILEKEK